ncbi:hypothetical protein HF638_17440 [Paenibacillus sp. SZ31]|uniref:hypothetical protein n=1 Tax=Paenibacillus sp. SZ31 TaxID=2725555 RepID=UPI00146F7288|nr:hypothetical protein [Paenibacillus sp. SZ31]NMI05764.1 hypothetical protein [Paenibacillus sp. SZ31]
MMKKKKVLMACAALAMVVALSACSSAADEPTGDTEKVDTEVSSGTGEQATNEGTSEATTSGVTETEGTTAPADSDSDSGEQAAAGNSELPENLPSDFPLPEDATIRLANSGENEGKQSAMVIFSTEQDMKTVSQLYKDYFNAKKLTDAGQTIDDKNIIIQGTDPETQDVWSLIGGTLAGQEGVIELTLTWTES